MEDLIGNTVKFTIEKLHLVRKTMEADKSARGETYPIDDDNVHPAAMEYNCDCGGEVSSATSTHLVMFIDPGIIRESLSAPSSTSTEPGIGDVALADAAVITEIMDLHFDSITNNYG